MSGLPSDGCRQRSRQGVRGQVSAARFGGGCGVSRLTLCLVALCLPTPSALSDELGTAGAVPNAYRDTAHLYGIPPALFYAMALQESGRTVGSAYRPWPWTLNVEGRAYYYDTKTEVWDALRRFVMEGRTHIGIGLMQVTYPYNAHVLWDVYAAIDPYTNLRMGALILRERYRESGDWWTAVGRYHAPGQKPAQIARAIRYRERVKHRWRRLYGPLTGELAHNG